MSLIDMLSVYLDRNLKELESLNLAWDKLREECVVVLSTDLDHAKSIEQRIKEAKRQRDVILSMISIVHESSIVL